MNKNKKNGAAVRKTAVLSMLAAVFVICSYIQLPFFIPFTLQTMALSFCLTFVGTRLTLWVLLVYTALGCVGLPVFSGFRGGVSALFDPTGGFIIGFFVMALTYGMLCKLLPSFKLKQYTALVLSLVPLHLCGILWYTFLYLEISLQGIASSFAVTSAVYILPDVAKIIAGGFCAERIKKYLKNS